MSSHVRTRYLASFLQVLFGDADAGRSDDKSARRNFLVLPNPLDQRPQPAAFARRFDLSRNAEMLDRRHVNQKAARQSDVRSDARAPSAIGSLAICEDLLALAKQIGDRRLRRTVRADRRGRYVHRVGRVASFRPRGLRSRLSLRTSTGASTIATSVVCAVTSGSTNSASTISFS